MRFDVACFRNLEKRVAQLGEQEVEADLILFHPYKKAQMDWFDAVDVAGLALDYCVKATALDARRAGFETVVHRSATRAVDVQPGDGERAVAELRAAGVQVLEADPDG